MLNAAELSTGEWVATWEWGGVKRGYIAIRGYGPDRKSAMRDLSEGLNDLWPQAISAAAKSEIEGKE